MLTYKVLAALLCYPTREVIDSLDEMAAVLDAERALPAAERRGLQELMDQLRASDLMDAEARYVELFDRARSLSLHLFEHIHGESRERGQAMVDLLGHYRAQGLEIANGELPDYLPLFLEFLSLRPPAQARQHLAEVVDIISVLAARLEKRGTPYRAPLRALEALAARRVDGAAIREAVAAEQPDDSPASRAAGEEAPVTFDDARTPSGCTAAASIVERFAPKPGA